MGKGKDKDFSWQLEEAIFGEMVKEWSRTRFYFPCSYS